MDKHVVATNQNDPFYYIDPTQATEKLLKTFSCFKYFTVTAASAGLTAGEKTAFWFIKQIKTLSEKWFTHIFLTFCLVSYTVLGAVIFMGLEGFHEKKEFKNLEKEFLAYAIARDDFLFKVQLTCEDSMNSTRDFGNLFEKELRNYEKVVKDYNKAFLLTEADDAPLAYKKTWKFWNSMLYAATVYSTIGYGHIAPKTMSGRIVTIFYSIIGIPIFLIVLADFGKLFTRGLKYSWANLRRIKKKIKKRYINHIKSKSSSVRRPSRNSSRRSGANVDFHINLEDGTESNACEITEEEINDKFDLPVSLALVLLLSYLFVGAAIFTLMEPWDYCESFYFTFISMSTIGLGDFVPSRPVYMVVIMFYLIFGLSLTSMSINVVQNKLNETFKEARQKLAATIGLSVENAFVNETNPPADNSENVKPAD